MYPNNLIDISDEEDAESLEDSSPEKGGIDYGPIEPGMKRIIVKNGEMEFPVNWFSEQGDDEVREMIVCATDAIMDSGFEILDPNGKPFDLEKDIHLVQGRGEKYTAVKGEEK